MKIEGFWDIVYIALAIVMVCTIVCYLIDWFKNIPKKKLDFIVAANKAGNVAFAKLTSWLRCGTHDKDYYLLEYMYVVDNKTYYVTYKEATKVILNDDREHMNADKLMLNYKPALLMFYDKKNPEKAYCKYEAFVSGNAMQKVKTKKNVYRDIKKVWTEPIDLVR